MKVFSLRRFGVIAGLAALATLLLAFAVSSSATTVVTCGGPTATGSNFEIDASANLKVDGSAPCIDWLNDSGSAYRAGVLAKADKPSGANDDSFGQGTAEDNSSPTIVDGSIPPNKSDLKALGAFSETAGGAKFLELFWSRVQNPSGTTNMDFELNQVRCVGTSATCAQNGTSRSPLFVTPKRTSGDKLITYDLSKGGTVPTISVRTWNGSAWGAATQVTGSARASVNTSAILDADSGPLGGQDPYTFGELAISYADIFGANQCGSFGSAYLKSRSSDSFTSEIKDFVAPEPVTISNCASLATTASGPVTIGNSISDTATLSLVGAGATGTMSFDLYGDSACATAKLATLAGTTAVNGPGSYTSTAYTPTAVGTYYWVAHYSGDANNSPAHGLCGDANESSVVNKAQPAIVTTASGPVTIGSSISDTATLSAATSDAGGTITFDIFSDSACATAKLTTVASTTAVSGSGNYTSAAYTPTAVGTYYWVAHYSGDAKNESVSGSCGDANESSVVNKAPSSISTAQRYYPNDAATIGGGGAGTVTFKLYGPNNATCDPSGNSAVYSQTVNVAGGSASTTNTATAVTTDGTYRWLVTYSGDASRAGRTSACGAEQFTLNHSDDPGPGTP
jgi:hypothetical protein